MAASLKISADTSDVKKSILSLNKSLKDLKGSKIAIFSDSDKKFIKSELKKEMAATKAKIKENREEIKKLADEQKKVVAGSQEELEIRKKILESYKIQAKLSKDLGGMGSTAKNVPGGGGLLKGLAGGGEGMMGMAMGAIGGAVLGAAAWGVYKGIQGTNQYVGGASNRVKLKGLGVNEDSFGSAESLARVGLSEQDMIQRRIDATSVLGRDGSNNQTEMQKASFERAFGLDGGTMTGIAARMRGQAGGAGATDIQMKLQASVMAAGIEDAIGPYLESAVSLLTNINESGTANTTEITGILAQLTKDGQRTPEMMSKTFGSINAAMKGATGESSAFLQNAFARAGIGGGTLGGTKFALSSGGLMGMNESSLAKRGYNPELLKNLKSSGMFTGVQDRASAVLNQFKSSAGMGSGQSMNSITGADQFVGMGNLANNVFGTKGDQGFDVLKMLEDVVNKKMSQKQFDQKLQKMQESNDPSLTRLDKINSTLAGQTDLLTNIDTNLAEALGKEGVTARNALKKIENEGTRAATGLAGAVNSTGVVTGSGNVVQKGMKYFTEGKLGEDLYDFLHPNEAMDQQLMMKTKKNGLDPAMLQGVSSSNMSVTLDAKSIGKEVAEALKKAPPTVNNNNVTTRIVMPDGKITERTSK